MKVLNVRNVNEAIDHGICHLLDDGTTEQSRNGEAIVAPTPVVTVYSNPTERVLFSPLRDANPFFHLMESLWMLAGRDDLAFPQQFNKRFGEYSDDGKTVHGAYGHRWRRHFGYDQLAVIANELKLNPQTRRCVLQMWDASEQEPYHHDGADDLHLAMRGGKDVPCNTHAYFDVRGGKLNMTVLCRSNDIIWGAYGANAVHFSILLEFMAAAVGVPVGEYRQFSNNFHVYTSVYSRGKLLAIAEEADKTNYYVDNKVVPCPLVNTPIGSWLEDLAKFMQQPAKDLTYSDPFFAQVAQPMYEAWLQRKMKAGNGMAYIEQMYAEDWKLACTQWIASREKGN